MLRKETQSVNPQAAMMSDPTMMMDMLKKNVHMIVPQMLTGAWVNFFFSGFVIAKIPFPLTQRFRTMLQRGIDLQVRAARGVACSRAHAARACGPRARAVCSVCARRVRASASVGSQRRQEMRAHASGASWACKHTRTRAFAPQSLDVTYVSSLSWYFLNLFGLRGLNQLLLGASASEAIDDTKLMGMQQQMMMGAGMDTSKAYAAELQQMELMRHSTAAMQGFEARAAATLAALERRGG